MHLTPDISVLIPTAKRPQFLANVLGSISRQTAVQRIAEVVVMENGGSRDSEAVCKQFPGLPIRYVFRESPVPIGGLVASWFAEPRFPLVAMVHDDDWWAARHLELSAAALELNPDAAAVYSAGHVVINETAWTYSLYGSFLAWFADDTAPAGGLRKLAFEPTLLASLLGNAFHMSSMLARQSAIQASLPGLNDGNEYDYDRSLAVELSRHGPLLFSGTPSAFIRMHPDQYSGVADASGRDRLWVPKNTRRLLKLAADCHVDARIRLVDRMRHLGLDFYAIASHCTDPALDTLYEEKLLPPTMEKDYLQRKRNRKIRAMARRILQVFRSTGI